MKKTISLLLVLTLSVTVLDSCKSKRHQLLGDWIIDSTFTTTQEGIQLSSNGQAASINQTRKQYTQWERHGSQLILKGKLFTEFDVEPFADTLRIARLNGEQLWTTHDSDLTKYRRFKQ